MADKIKIELHGQALTGAAEPEFLASSVRSAGVAADSEFLPANYLQVESAFALSGAARGAGGEALEHEVPDERVLVLELADGSTLVTSAARMQAALRRNRPDLLGPDGAILFERLQADDTPARGAITDIARGIVSKVFTIAVGANGARDAILDAAENKLAEWLVGDGHNPLARGAEIGVSWLGTKALMWAIEQRLDRPAGRLYAWNSGRALAEQPWHGANESVAAGARILVFVHGFASSTLGSFGDLQAAGSEVWAALSKAYPDRIYGFEHRTLSESPIENALQLVEALPPGARVSLVTHSRGGLVGDLLCLGDLEDHVAGYGYAFTDGAGAVDPRSSDSAGDFEGETQRVLGEMGAQYAAQRIDLAKLAAALRAKKLVIERYVRVASPAQGTKLASGNFDVFLSGLLSLIGAVPALVGNPLYAAFKRALIEIAKNRTNPHLVPGIEAMLPDGPMAALLRATNVQAQPMQVAVLAGDIEGGNLLVSLG